MTVTQHSLFSMLPNILIQVNTHGPRVQAETLRKAAQGCLLAGCCITQPTAMRKKIAMTMILLLLSRLDKKVNEAKQRQLD